jgi:uncharacterized protein (DUF2336 family)
MKEIWWERRRDGEATPAYLARVLTETGLPDLAANARACWYDDFLCPPEIDDGLNIHRLVRDLGDAAGGRSVNTRARIDALIKAAKDGEFDSTREESKAWEQSEEGRATIQSLMRGD